MKFFRCAEAWKGRQLQTDVVFQGSPDQPCEVELDESLLKRVKVYGEDGVRTGRTREATRPLRLCLVIPGAAALTPAPVARVAR